jgi:hypothetical protein
MNLRKVVSGDSFYNDKKFMELQMALSLGKNRSVKYSL